MRAGVRSAGCQGFEPRGALRLAEPLTLDRRRRRVLVTGAAGRIGSGFAAHAADSLELRLMDRRQSDHDALAAHGEAVVCELSDTDGLRAACEGIDTVVHLAADADYEAGWESVLENNIEGTFNVFDAAAAARCRRIVFASSIHAVGGYPRERQVAAGDAVNPGNLYGVSKCFGEALGRYVAEQRGVSVIALRIGAFAEPGTDVGEAEADIFLAAADLYQLIERAIHVEGVRFAIFNAISDTPVKRLDIGDAIEILGYEPSG